MRIPLIPCLAVLLALPLTAATAARNNPNTDWFKDARYGVFMHFLPADAAGLGKVAAFDVAALARQLQEMGAGYFVLTLGQNSGFFNAPNAAYDRLAGYQAGERCSRRDLPAELHAALQPLGIRLMLYLPCQVPNQDARAQRAFGLREGPQDQPLSVEFARKWAEVIREWSDRYGDQVSGWWFDGGYQHIRFDDSIAAVYADAARHGNPRSIVTFNPGVKLVRHTAAEDYTAGELNDPFTHLPQDRWVDGSQWHALTFLGRSWSGRETRHPTDAWAQWVRDATARGGVVTLDMGPNWDAEAGPIGGLAEAQVQQVRAIRKALGSIRPSAAPAGGTPARLRRSESFLGVHFDFHAGADCTEVGRHTTPAMVESIIDQVRPDYLQVDCKGHPGFSSYPTRVGHPAPGFVGDPLRVWRDATAQRGVALYMHYSGVWDSEAIRRHPDWAALNAEGSTNANATSFFSPYADRLLVPQLRELAGEYGVDGAWVDGECWASVPDYGAAAREAFTRSTGISAVPRKPGEPHWYEWLQFNREAYRGYLRRYVSAVKQTHPEFQLCSNWAFTDHMPEPVSAPVDWISGDYSPEDSVNSARFSARYMAGQGKPWDLMAWSFTTKPGPGGRKRKSAPQLQREAASVLALGGGFQAYITQNRDGSVRLEEIPVMAEVARFCRERQAFTHRSVPVPQVAFLYSTASHYREMNGLFNRDLSRMRGTLQALLECQQSVEILGEHNLTGRMKEYPLIVVPELSYLAPAFRDELIRYARDGGHLLLVGPQTAGLFADVLQASLEGEPRAATGFLAHAGQITPVKDAVQAVRLAGARPVGDLCTAADPATAVQPAASVATLGQGRVMATYCSLSRGYLADRSPVAREFLASLVRELFPQPLAEVRGSPDVDVSVNRLGGRLLVNLVNTAGPHADPNTPIFDAIPPVGPLEIRLRTPQAPSRITLEPGARTIAFKHEDGQTRLTLPSLAIHEILVVE